MMYDLGDKLAYAHDYSSPYRANCPTKRLDNLIAECSRSIAASQVLPVIRVGLVNGTNSSRKWSELMRFPFNNQSTFKSFQFHSTID